MIESIHGILEACRADQAIIRVGGFSSGSWETSCSQAGTRTERETSDVGRARWRSRWLYLRQNTVGGFGSIDGARLYSGRSASGIREDSPGSRTDIGATNYLCLAIFCE